MNKKQLDYIYEYLDNLAESLGNLETEVQRIDNELFKMYKALEKRRYLIGKN